MDPSNRRFVWSFLEQFKQGRVIVLTTHSMEEADILGDKIAIMSKGRLKAVGKSVRLKNKFGTGYRISMIVPRGDKVADVKAMVEKRCPDAILDEEEIFGGSGKTTGDSAGKNASDGQTARLVYAAPTIDVVKSLVLFLEQISSDKENNSEQNGPLISSFGMSQTSLEDVFMRMVKEKNE